MALPLLAFRSWAIENFSLYGAFWVQWSVPTMDAICRRGGTHLVPDLKCSCGIYAFYSLADVDAFGRQNWGSGDLLLDSFMERKLVNAVYGMIVLTGKVFLYPNGVRGQRARIVALVRPYWVGPEIMRVLAQKYSVPWFELAAEKEMIGIMAEHGQMAIEARPKRANLE